MAALDSFITLNPARLVAKGSDALYYDVVLDETTGALKVELGASVDIGDVTLLAGAAIIGKVGIDQTTDGTTNAVRALGPSSTGRLLSAAGTSGDATNVKASAGRVYGIQGANVNAAARYLKLYNSASAPTAGAGTPIKTLYLPPNMAFAFDLGGYQFSTGIGFTLVTGSADNSSTSVTAGDILALNVDYA